MTKDEALKMALEALMVATTPFAKDRQTVIKAQTALRQALEQPEREWVGLTDEERKQFSQWAHIDVVRRLEKTLKEKNT